MMKRALWLLPLLVLSNGFAEKAKTTADLEMHSSGAPLPGADIKTSSMTPNGPALTDSQTLQKLTLELQSTGPRTKLQAVDDLGTLGPKAKANLPALADLLTDPVAGREAARSIHKIDPTYAVPPAVLSRLVRRAVALPERERIHTGWVTRCDSQTEALDTLGALGPSARNAIPDLVKLTHRACVHDHVVDALSHIGSPDPAQVAQIAGGLEDKDPEARQAAIEYLAKSNPTDETVRSFGRAMNDPNSGVRLSALQALEEIHPEGEGRLPLLQDFYKDPSSDIRERVIYMVSQLPREARSAIPLLHQALHDPEPAIALLSCKILADKDPRDEPLENTLISFMKEKGSARSLQAGNILESLNVHDARVDAALEPYREQKALWERIAKASSGTSPEQLAENGRTLKVENLRIASGLIDNQPVHVARAFSSGIGRLYCWTEVSITAVPATMIHRWFRNGRLQHEEYLGVTSAHSTLWSSAAVSAGNWKVDVLSAGSTEPLATAVFAVTKHKE